MATQGTRVDFGHDDSAERMNRRDETRARKRIRRVGPPTNFVSAVIRKQQAEDAAMYLRKALANLRYAPQTREKVRRAIKSADGAVRHAERMLSEYLAQTERGQS